jgi:hypothetical protein
MARAHRRLGCLALVSVALVLIAAPACGGLGSHCADYCDRFHECVDSTIDIGKCEDACHDWADGKSDRESKVDKCSECVSQNDVCSDVNRRCFADCVGIPVR